jgi:hemolysin-activating ACP:hemolysin acyltransferase
MFDEIKIIISLYRRFDRYKRYSDKELLFHILPSYQLKQYKLHKQGDEVIAFTNWAFLNDDAQNRFISTGILTSKDWKSGINVWHMDIICVKNFKKVMSWIKSYYTNLLGVNKEVHWARISNDNKIYKITKTLTKEHYK